jgi:hypothetical protein
VLLESVWLILCIFLISLPLTLWKKLKILRSLGSPKIYSCLEKCKVHFQEKELRGGHVGVSLCHQRHLVIWCWVLVHML